MIGLGSSGVYILCLITSVVCAGLLLRSWRRSGTRFLMWCALAFSLLALNNLFVVSDMILFPSIELWAARQAAAFAAVAVLLYAFIWEIDG
jgi:hypothetical protein